MRYVVFWSFLGLLTLSNMPFAHSKKIRFSNTNQNKVQITDTELAMRPANTSAYAESWALWTWNKEGYNIYALVVVTKMIIGMKLGVQLTIRNPQGKIEHKMVEYDVDKFRYKTDRLDILVPRTHRVQFRRNKGFLTINFPSWGIRINYKRKLRGFRLQQGPICMRGKCFVGLPYAPRIEVDGTLRVEGKTFNYKGIGYADHSWQNLMPHHISRRWYAARAYNKDYSIIATHLLPPDQWTPQNIAGLSIAKGDKWIFHAGIKTGLHFVTREPVDDPNSGYSVPQRVIYRGKANGIQATVDIRHLKEYDNFDILSQFNRVLRFLIQKLISRPYLYRYRALMKVSLKFPDGKTEKFELTAYTEWTFLNK